MKKDWWKDFFDLDMAEIMFDNRKEMAAREVDYILKKAKPPQKGKILDLACGIGRHSFLFAKKGYDVTGLDFSSQYIKYAKIQAKKAKGNTPGFIQGDMKEIASTFDPNSFDLVTSLYNSFGYFDTRQDDYKVLKQISIILKPKGKLVLNTLNLGGVEKRILAPVKNGYEIKENLFMLDHATFDKKKKQTNSSWTLIDARKSKTKIKRAQFRQNVYSHEQLKKKLEQYGMKVRTIWSKLEGAPYKKDSWHQTFVAEKLP